MDTQEIKVAREKAATTLASAQGFAKELREQKDPARKAEISEKFDRAYADFTAAQADFQRAESLAKVDSEYEKLQRPAANAALKRSGVEPENAEFKAFHSETFHLFMSRGEAFANAKLATAPKETHALLSAQDDLGGFLVPEDFRAEVIKDLAGFATFRAAGARVVPTNRQQLVYPSIKPASGTTNDNSYSSNVSGKWRNEGDQGTDGTAPANQNQPTFGQERIPVHIWQPDCVVVTQEFLEDSAVSVDSILAELFAEVKALDEDYVFTNGQGSDRPQGLLQSGIASVNTGAATTLKYGGIIDLYSATPAQYRQNGAWMMNSKTYGGILKLESTGGFLLFPPNAAPGTLMGKPVFFNEFMPDVAAGTKPIAFGAFRYYVIAERTELRVQRLTERFAPNIALLPTARIGGAVVRKNAFRLQNVSA